MPVAAYRVDKSSTNMLSNRFRPFGAIFIGIVARIWGSKSPAGQVTRRMKNPTINAQSAAFARRLSVSSGKTRLFAIDKSIRTSTSVCRPQSFLNTNSDNVN